MKEGHMTPSQDGKSPARVTRRAFVVNGGTAIAGGAILATIGAHRADAAGSKLSTSAAHKAAVAGDILLIDIRRPDEWQHTGVGQGALPLDMRRRDFTDVLLQRTGGRTDTPVALICARGVRSRAMTARLQRAGFTNIIDVPEGMLGSGAGPGWLKRKLPLVKYTK